MKFFRNFHPFLTKKISTFHIWEGWVRSSIIKRRDHASIRELVWTLVPTFILLIIAIPSIELLYFMDVVMSKVDPIFTYKIIGHQWFWSYDYFGVVWSDSSQVQVGNTSFDSYMVASEDFDLTNGECLRLLEVDNSLVLPTHNNLHLLITSADVLHSWAVPSLGVKIDAVPGRINHIILYVDRVGSFYGQCSEICGVNHGFMPIKVEAVDLNYQLLSSIIDEGSLETEL